MSLGIAIKGTEGLVLAADSRVTILMQAVAAVPGQPPVLIPATFDHATKLLKVHLQNQTHVGAVTFGTGAIGTNKPRTARSLMPEFERELGDVERLSVKKFAERLSGFFLQQWVDSGTPTNLGDQNDMVFFVGGYDQNDLHGSLFKFSVPTRPTPELAIADGQFGAAWGGQREITDRILLGFDPSVPSNVEDILTVPLPQRNPDAVAQQLRARLTAPIPWQFLPLQDCVDLAIFLVRATINYQRFTVGVRGVGGAIDVATITRVEGFEEIQAKHIFGEKDNPAGRSRT